MLILDFPDEPDDGVSGLLLLDPVITAGGTGIGTKMIGAGVVVVGLVPLIGEPVPGLMTMGLGVGAGVKLLQSGTKQQLLSGSVTRVQLLSKLLYVGHL